MRAETVPRDKLSRFLRSVLDPRAYIHILRLVHYYNYSHVKPRRLVQLGPGVRLAPNVSFTNAERIQIGARTQVGARGHLWAGDSSGRIIIGEDATFGPEVFLTASDYGSEPGSLITDQARVERDIVVGNGVWLGARVIVTAGVTIGDGCIVGAGSVVTRDLEAGSIAVGSPARTVRMRGEQKLERSGAPDNGEA